MDILTIGVVAAIAVVGVTAIAPRVGVAAPLLLVALGVAVSLVPQVPAVEIEPEWILAGVLPPLLYATSVAMPTMDFRRDLTAISGLSVALVVITSVALGFLFSWLIPGVGLATGIALGAILSPTDAVATSIVRRSGVSPRIVTVLEGESLLNDASALVLMRSAIAATGLSFSFGEVVGDFIFAVAVAVAIGFLVGRVSLFVRSRLSDAHLTTAISFIVPFVAYLPAEHLGASGLVATVTAGLVSGVGSAKYLRPQDRLAEAANWKTLELLLEGAVFLVMGLELYGLVTEVQREDQSLLNALGLAALAVVVVLLARAGYITFLLRGLARRARRGATVRGVLTKMGERTDQMASMTREDMAALRLPGRPPGQRLLEQTDTVDARDARDARDAHDAFAGDRARSRRGPGGREGGPRGPQAGGRAAGRDGEAPETRLQSLRARITRRVADIDYLQAESFGVREGTVLVWAGMRGVVTLAAAQSLPADTPQRALLVLVAFTVAAGTLLLQGGTLRWVVRRLHLARASDDGAELDRLISELGDAAVAFLDSPDLRRPDGKPYDARVLEKVRRGRPRRQEEIEPAVALASPALTAQVVETAEPGESNETTVASEGLVEVPALVEKEQREHPDDPMVQFRQLRLAVIKAQREALLHIRSLGTSSSAALTSALAMLDADQISAELRVRD